MRDHIQAQLVWLAQLTCIMACSDNGLYACPVHACVGSPAAVVPLMSSITSQDLMPSCHMELNLETPIQGLIFLIGKVRTLYIGWCLSSARIWSASFSCKCTKELCWDACKEEKQMKQCRRRLSCTAHLILVQERLINVGRNVQEGVAQAKQVRRHWTDCCDICM